MNLQKQNISDEEFSALLAGPADAGPGAADALRAALSSYRTETLQWAERRSATQPSLQGAARRSRMWAAVPQWSLAAVAVISIAAGVAHVYDRSDAGDEITATAPVSVAAPAARTSAADIAADNRLLSSIDQALSYHTASPLDDPGLKSEHRDKAAASGVID